MRICFLATARSIHSYRWIEYFSERSYEIFWIFLGPSRFGKVKNVRTYQLGSFFNKPLSILFNIMALRRIIKEIKPDILHAHYAGVNGILAALSGFHPFILSAWGSDIFIASKRRLSGSLVKFSLSKADLILCNGKPLAEEMIRLKIQPSKIKFAYWSTDTQKFRPLPKDKKIREELKVFAMPMVISLRSLEPHYNVETLVRALPIVLKEFPQVKFVIGGDGSERKKLEKMSKELKISDSIKFIGWIDYEDVPCYLNSADIYVSTSLSDGDLAQSTQQAMACQIPIITSDLAVNIERIRDGENGLIFPRKDYRSLAGRITQLLKDNNLRIKLGERGREIILRDLDFNKNMAKVEKIYYSLIEK